ncbi:class I mannose-6-phosphate isomerase [Sphingomonas xanthus]|uniref:Phosphoheptose isomerase n=1 Tax=Sphingomonas xanthus TaxID=2594473 RepID=A0A516IS25_9SPHN|nr:class I mannose-6-phosphate isomerase [Sphingomonas xanthus]QDP19712.1 phosphoheptose isomerase [Sphingomonas xanthus]
MQRLATRIVEKPWGRCGLDPCFGAAPKQKVGEIWFESPAGRPFDVMAKYLFTTERLSVQVHPDDEAARAAGHAYGKDECWIVLEATDDAEIGIGTCRPLGRAELVEAARSGAIADLVEWRKPRRGDVIYNPAGTIHSLGAGLTVLEIQQAADLTYRLYDYGRERDLHLQESADVARAEPHHHPVDGQVGDASRILVDGPHFGVAWCVGVPPPLPAMRDIQLLPIDAEVAGLRPGECGLVDELEVGSLASGGNFVLAWSHVQEET